MAFSKAPSQSTYQSKETKLIWTMFNRSASLSKDPLLKNGFYETVKGKESKDNEYFVVKREGTTQYPWVPPSTVLRGNFYWEDQDKLFCAYDDKVAIITASNGIEQTTLTPFTTTTGEVSFTEFYFEDGTSKIVIGDGQKLVTVDTANTMVTSTSPDLPVPFIPNLLFLDGYLFIIKAGTADIYNSNLNDPLAFTAGDFLSAEMLPDTLIRISRLNNYLIAFGSSSVEYFFDAGNASGSPMQRNDTPVKQIGYLGGFATYGNKVYCIAQYANTAPELFILEDFKMEEINLPPIRRFLQQTRDFSASIVTNGGHDFYVLTANGETYAMDLDTKLWSIWTFGATNTFDIRNAISIYLASGYVSLFSVAGDSKIYFFDPEAYTDQGAVYEFAGVLSRQVWDTLHRKFMNRLLVYADKGTGTLNISWSDDDYQTYSTPRGVNLASSRPFLTRLGAFFSRALKWSFSENAPCRLMYFEVDYNIGSS